jgi:molybdenum cofactor cytidylyltransferase
VIAGVVLAAGTSSRLGTPKQLLKLGRKVLLQHVVDAAAESSLDEIIVVLGHEAAAVKAALELPDHARVAINEDYAAGQSTSLRAGLRACSSDAEAAAILLGDQPGITAELIDAVVEEWRATRSPLLRAMFGETPGHPVVIAREQWALADRARGDAGLRSVLMEFDRIHDVHLGGRPPADVDTWEEYEELLRAAD